MCEMVESVGRSFDTKMLIRWVPLGLFHSDAPIVRVPGPVSYLTDNVSECTKM